MTAYHVVYELHLCWLGDSSSIIYDCMSEAIEAAATCAASHPEAHGLILVILWRPGYPRDILAYCSLAGLHQWKTDIIKDALL